MRTLIKTSWRGMEGEVLRGRAINGRFWVHLRFAREGLQSWVRLDECLS